MFEEAIINAFNAVTPNLDELYESARTYDLDNWKLVQRGLVTASGATSTIIPGMHLIGMAADVVFLMNRMAVCSYGIGAILTSRAGKGNILEQEDFGVVLTRWSGDDSLSNASVAKTAAGLASHMGTKSVGKILAKVAAEQAGILVGKKFGIKAGAKVVGKFTAKMGTKALGGFFPFVGPAIGAGVNLWFINSVAEEAEAWYGLKLACDNEK
jgi:hypothetical protein